MALQLIKKGEESSADLRCGIVETCRNAFALPGICEIVFEESSLSGLCKMMEALELNV